MTMAMDATAMNKVATVAVLGRSGLAKACLRRLDSLASVKAHAIHFEELRTCGADLVVAVPNVTEAMAWRAYARDHLLERHVPLLPVLFLPESTVIVGPTCHPPHTACLRCLHLRLTANGVTHEGLPDLAHHEHGRRLVEKVAERVAQHLSHPRQASTLEAINLHHDRVTHHLVLPVPLCVTCRGGNLPAQADEGPLQPGIQETDLETSLGKLNPLVSSLAGIIQVATRVPYAQDEALLVHEHARMGPTEDILGTPCVRWGDGFHPDTAPSRAAAIGEALERYAPAWVPQDRVVFGTAQELGDEALRPESFALFHPTQHAEVDYPYVPFTETTPVRWIRGASLPDGKPVYAPLQLVLRNPGLADGEAPIGYSTTNGTACGQTREEAVLSALLEVAERDAFCVTWFNSLTLPLLDLASSAWLEEKVDRYFRHTRTSFRLVDLSAINGVPTVMAMVRSEPGDLVAMSVGMASAVDAEHAAFKALREAYQTRATSRRLRLEEPDWRPMADAHNVDDFWHHGLQYAFEETADLTRFLDASPVMRSFASVPTLAGDSVTDRVHSLTRALMARDVTVSVVDITSPDLRDRDLRVVKAVCPEMCQLGRGQRLRFLGGRRLYEGAWKVGLRAEPLRFEDLNELLEPFS